MRRRVSYRWLIAAGALAVVLSMGAVACSSDTPQGGAAGTTTVEGQRQSAQGRQGMQERKEARVERRQALQESLRKDMTPEDQAQYDELVASAEAQRVAMQEARQELAATLKELRVLTDKYVDLSEAGGK